MLEDKSKRKNTIKNIAIVFLSIMLVLTLFSNTFMNYSLVEVSTQMVRSDSITTKVRGSGVVEANDSYSVTIKESRKIATVDVRTGATVEKGDVLFTLEDAESEELTAARKSLLEAENAYETAVLESGITVAERKAIESGNTGSLSDKQNTLLNAQAAVDSAQATVDSLTAQIAALTDAKVDTSAEEIQKLNANRDLAAVQKTESEKETAYNDAKSNMLEKKSTYETAKSVYETAVNAHATQKAGNDAIIASGGTPSAEDIATLAQLESKMNSAKSAMDSAKSEYDSATSSYNSAASAYTEATKATSAAKQKVDDIQYSIDLKTLSSSTDATAATLKNQLATANTTLSNAQAKQTEVKTRVMAQISLSAQYEALATLRSDVAKLESEAEDAQVVAPIAGTVTEILYTAGQNVPKDETVMLIQPENKAFVLRFTTTADLAKNIKVGDTANILNNWYGNDITASVYAIKKNPTDKSSVEVVCELSGDVSAGSNYTVSIGEKSANYDLVVPTSSIREDSNGKFILVIESKNTPLGNRYYARRTNVEVIASDDTYSAISAPLEGYEYVITTTTKPVEENQQVRLAD
ncbi:MAG: HlyD family efflux transporter periplasmic adaptor subunit [Agathobacter sp.]